MVEKFINAGHLRRYIKEIDHGVESGQVADRVIAATAALLESRLAINNILGGLSDDHYLSKCQKNKLMRAATVKA